jgi:hypothetical protein
MLNSVHLWASAVVTTATAAAESLTSEAVAILPLLYEAEEDAKLLTANKACTTAGGRQAEALVAGSAGEDCSVAFKQIIEAVAELGPDKLVSALMRNARASAKTELSARFATGKLSEPAAAALAAPAFPPVESQVHFVFTCYTYGDALYILHRYDSLNFRFQENTRLSKCILPLIKHYK